MKALEFDQVTFHYPENTRNIFTDLSLSLPGGIVSLIGQNGTGKSTLLLLAAGNLLPVKGKVRILGIDTTDLRDESTRQRYVSFIFQNMEFETEEKIGELLCFVYENGFHEKKESDFITELIKVFELKKILNKRTQEISKGELQRTILAFSLLYGSEIVLMDEPIFAMEDYQKKRSMDFLASYARHTGIALFYSVHELEISENYSDQILLFDKTGGIRLGPTEIMFDRNIIEEAYQAPMQSLKLKEALYREVISRTCKTTFKTNYETN